MLHHMALTMWPALRIQYMEKFLYSWRKAPVFLVLTPEGG